jgi:hypothetical protein
MNGRIWAGGAAVLIQCLTLWLFLVPARDAVLTPQGARTAVLLLMPPAPLLPLPLPLTPPAKVAPPPRQARAMLRQDRQPATTPVQPEASNNQPHAAPPPDSSAPDPFALQQAPTSASIVDQAKRDLRWIDKEILGKAKGVPDDRPETLEERLARDIASAYVGNDTAETTHHYTAPDGMVYTRITRGPHTRCFMNRAADYTPVTASSEKWRSVRCPPANSGWVR